MMILIILIRLIMPGRMPLLARMLLIGVQISGKASELGPSYFCFWRIKSLVSKFVGKLRWVRLIFMLAVAIEFLVSRLVGRLRIVILGDMVL